MLEKLVSNTSAVELDLFAQATMTQQTGAVPAQRQTSDEKKDRDADREDQQDRYEPQGPGSAAAEEVDFGQTLRQATLLTISEPPSHPGQMFLPGMGFDFSLRRVNLLPPRPPAPPPEQLLLPGMGDRPLPAAPTPLGDARGRQLDLEG